MSQILADRRVLVVEDEFMVLMVIETMLADLGCTAIRSAATGKAALGLLAAEQFDIALLDMNLAGDRSFVVADALAADHVPFAFCTGYSNVVLGAHEGRPVINKPYDEATFAATVERLLAAPSLAAVD